VDFTKRQKDSTSTKPDGTSNPVQDIDPQIDDSDPASDDGDDELCRSPLWYRFGASAITTKSTENPRDYARPCYVAQVKDAYHEREFHNIISKEYIDGELSGGLGSDLGARPYIAKGASTASDQPLRGTMPSTEREVEERKFQPTEGI
jgi:hypothetical protein